MKKISLLTALAVFLGTSGSAATYVASFSGDVCSIPPGFNGADSNCSLIEQAGNPAGMFTLSLGAVDSNIVGDATVTIRSSSADLFLNDDQIANEIANLPPGTPPRANIRNNLNESFVLSLDTLVIGRLFDGIPEGGTFPGLAASVQSNIDSATNSSDPILLNFVVPNNLIKPLLSDSALEVAFDFRAPDPFFNVNAFFDPTVVVEYATAAPNPQVIPLPASMWLLLAGATGLGIASRRRKQG